MPEPVLIDVAEAALAAAAATPAPVLRAIVAPVARRRVAHEDDVLARQQAAALRRVERHPRAQPLVRRRGSAARARAAARGARRWMRRAACARRRGGGEAVVGKPLRRTERAVDVRQHDRIAAMRRPSEQPTARTGVGVVEVTAPLASFDFSTAERWELLVLCHGEPVARLRVPLAGRGRLGRAGARADLAARRGTGARAGARAAGCGGGSARPAAPAPQPPSCSVVLCTHGRPAAPARPRSTRSRGSTRRRSRSIVVDNAPGEQRLPRGGRGGSGFRYVREDRKGLDNARNAGVARRARRGRRLHRRRLRARRRAGCATCRRAFADPLVAAVTGPAFPYRARHPRPRAHGAPGEPDARPAPARVRLDADLAAARAGRPASGANMLSARGAAARRARSRSRPSSTPGTETQSGGDTYAVRAAARRRPPDRLRPAHLRLPPAPRRLARR